MPTKKTTASNAKAPSATAQQSLSYHRVDALLRTMRRITQYEDALCELSHELRGVSGFSKETSDELSDILDKIPSHDFVSDLESLRAILAKPAPLKLPNSRKITKSAKSRTSPAAGKSKSARATLK